MSLDQKKIYIISLDQKIYIMSLDQKNIYYNMFLRFFK